MNDKNAADGPDLVQVMSHLPCSCRRRCTFAAGTRDTGSGVSCRQRTFPLCHVTCSRTSGLDAPTAKTFIDNNIHTPHQRRFRPLQIVSQQQSRQIGLVSDETTIDYFVSSGTSNLESINRTVIKNNYIYSNDTTRF